MEEKELNRLKIVFFGTPDFAAHILRDLVQSHGVAVQAVLTQPDRPCGRGRICKPSPVKELALAQALPVMQPESLRGEQVRDELAALDSDFFVVAAYGLLLPRAILDLPRHGALNVHASLLPRHRGASPIQTALLQGDIVTGVSIMRMVQALDAGPVGLQRALGIDINDTAQTLHDQLAALGGRLLLEALDRHRQGVLCWQEQDHSLATYAPRLTKSQGEINWNQPARAVHNHVRAMHPWPGAFFHLPQPATPDQTSTPGQTSTPDQTSKPGQATKPVQSSRPSPSGRRVGILPGSIGDPLQPGQSPGTFLGVQQGGLAIACADRAYLVPRLRPSHAREMDAQGFYCGYLRDVSRGDPICHAPTPLPADD